MQLQELNRWWAEKEVPRELVPTTYRATFHEVKRELGRRQVQVITGLRRTGKSTILLQLIDSLIKAGKGLSLSSLPDYAI